MKRMVLILTIMALILSFSNVSVAQITEKGIKAGFYMASATGSDVDDVFGMDVDVKSKNGFAIGGYVLYPLNETITLRPEVLYCQKGAIWEGTMSGIYSGYPYEADFTFTAMLTYLEIPVLFQYDFQSSGTMKPYVFAGPYVAFKMSAKTKTEIKVSVSGQTESETDTEDMDDVKGTDYGLVFGVGAKVTDKIHIDARYSMGMTSIDDSSEDMDIKNKVIAITAGYALN